MKLFGILRLFVGGTEDENRTLEQEGTERVDRFFDAVESRIDYRLNRLADRLGINTNGPQVIEAEPVDNLDILTRPQLLRLAKEEGAPWERTDTAEDLRESIRNNR